MSDKLMRWVLTGAVALALGGSVAGKASAEPTEAPRAEVASRAADQARRAAVVAELEARRAADTARQASEQAANEVRQRLREMEGWLSRVRDGNLYALAARGKVEMEKAAYLGVTTSSVPAALREHLKLPRGFGLVVDTIDKESAAAQAGVQRYDILQKFNDQLLVNSQQLGVLVRSMKPGDEVRLTVLRAGETKEISVKLTEKELPVLSDGAWNAAFGDVDWVGTFEAPLPPVAPVAPGAFGGVKLNKDGQQQRFRFFGLEGDSEVGQSVYQDGEMTLTVTDDAGKKTLVAKDKDGQTLFEGEITTPEQRETLPQPVAEKLAKFEEKLEKIPGAGTGRVKIRIVEP